MARNKVVRRIRKLSRSGGHAGLFAGTGYASGSRNAGKTTERFYAKTPANRSRRKRLAGYLRNMKSAIFPGHYERFMKSRGYKFENGKLKA